MRPHDLRQRWSGYLADHQDRRRQAIQHAGLEGRIGQRRGHRLAAGHERIARRFVLPDRPPHQPPAAVAAFHQGKLVAFPAAYRPPIPRDLLEENPHLRHPERVRVGHGSTATGELDVDRRIRFGPERPLRFEHLLGGVGKQLSEGRRPAGTPLPQHADILGSLHVGKDERLAHDCGSGAQDRRRTRGRRQRRAHQVDEVGNRHQVHLRPLLLRERVLEHHQGGVALGRRLGGDLAVVAASARGQRVEVDGLVLGGMDELVDQHAFHRLLVLAGSHIERYRVGIVEAGDLFGIQRQEERLQIECLGDEPQQRVGVADALHLALLKLLIELEGQIPDQFLLATPLDAHRPGKAEPRALADVLEQRVGHLLQGGIRRNDQSAGGRFLAARNAGQEDDDQERPPPGRQRGHVEHSVDARPHPRRPELPARP